MVTKLIAGLTLAGLLLLPSPGSGTPQATQTTQSSHSPHGNLNISCQNCHTVYGWKPIRAVPEFDHNQTRYPLRGMHEGVTCTACHTKMVFTNVGNKCADCHADIHKHKMGENCESCHTVRGWKVSIQQINQHMNRFPLTGAHAAATCDDCHKNGAVSNFTTMSTACFSCHQKDYSGAKNPDHAAGKFSTTCETCHTTDNWLNAKFDHSATGFPLTGMHTVPPRACVDCHVNNNYNLPQTACVGCHLKDYQNSKNPDHVKGGFPQTCETCHSTAAWQPASFDHSKTGFPLANAHNVPPRQCADCHVNNNYNITDTSCISCHQGDYNNAKTPIDHIGANFPTTCATCHDTVAWTDGKFDHAQTGWALTGMHTVPPRACIDCHTNNNYNLKQTTCVTCHLTDYNNTNNPNHAQQGFAQTCEICHSTAAWQPAQFDHAKSGFPLTGAHTVPPRACTDCHVNNNYNITDTSCVSCHQSDYNNAKTPVDHLGAKLPTTCANCHDTVAWTNGKFDHTQTGWALTGMHTVPPRACSDCHVNGNYNLTQTTCVSCHLKDFQGAKNPDHVQGGFPQTCESCHTTTAWQPANFDHSKTGFALTGMHTVPPRQCADCHVNNNYNLTQTACVSCHQTDYNNAKTPVDHIQAKFPTTCETCHDTTSWTDANFDHSQTGWALTGSHTVPPRACVDCHVNGNYNLTQTTCVACHQTDYNNAKTPVDHITANFPTTCETCHDTVVWTDGKFDHSQTGWALTGMHTVPPRACSDCHVNNNYKLNNTACVTCHLTDYNNTNNPNHANAGFPQTCELCHDTVNWTDANFDHSKTGFPLTNSHMVPPRTCTDCHVNNNYTSLPTDCYGCHKTDYLNTNSPNHTAAHFPTTCETCHDTIKWTDANFNHSYFPLNHGNANGICSNCHTNPNDYSVFQCTDCHTKSQTDPKHSGVKGYVYNSPNCYQCHKSGGGG